MDCEADHCLTCSGTDKSKCTACVAGYALDNAQTAETCYKCTDADCTCAANTLGTCTGCVNAKFFTAGGPDCNTACAGLTSNDNVY